MIITYALWPTLTSEMTGPCSMPVLFCIFFILVLAKSYKLQFKTLLLTHFFLFQSSILSPNKVIYLQKKSRNILKILVCKYSKTHWLSTTTSLLCDNLYMVAAEVYHRLYTSVIRWCQLLISHPVHWKTCP